MREKIAADASRSWRAALRTTPMTKMLVTGGVD